MVNKHVTNFTWKTIFNNVNTTSFITILYNSIHSLFLVPTKCEYLQFFTHCQNLQYAFHWHCRISLFRFLYILFIIYWITNQFINLRFFASLHLIKSITVHLWWLKMARLTWAQKVSANDMMDALQKCFHFVCALLNFNTGIWSKEIFLYGISDTL